TGNRGVVSAGTGLGEAGLFWDGLRYHPFACEGGHCDFSPRDEETLALYQFVRPQCTSPGWEEFLAGRSFMRLYHFTLSRSGTRTPAWLAEEMERGLPAAAVSQAGNESRCPVCRHTNQLFLKLYAMEAANLALKLMATGGIYLGGGIIPKLLPSLDPEVFAATFRGTGPLREVLARIPVRIILNDKAALLGAAWFAQHRASA
ncbi:MAG: glucokinase, partial [Verrucomicrobiia bacterium]